MLFLLFLIAQITLMIFMLLHDWLDIPPFTNIKALREKHSLNELILSTLVNAGTIAWCLIILRTYYPGPYPCWVKINWIIIYTLLTVGTICAWWLPYIFGSSPARKEGLSEYKHTHTFLPARGDNTVPNTLHILIHIQVWFCCVVSWYLLLQK
ncbi:MAG TPA: hypothetical protein VGT41_06845 [Candidatus Babeliales bacterium]|nr:hypothetical protein [Candidatus Babeliales bacterium]